MLSELRPSRDGSETHGSLLTHMTFLDENVEHANGVGHQVLAGTFVALESDPRTRTFRGYVHADCDPSILLQRKDRGHIGDSFPETQSIQKLEDGFGVGHGSEAESDWIRRPGEHETGLEYFAIRVEHFHPPGTGKEIPAHLFIQIQRTDDSSDVFGDFLVSVVETPILGRIGRITLEQEGRSEEEGWWQGGVIVEIVFEPDLVDEGDRRW